MGRRHNRGAEDPFCRNFGRDSFLNKGPPPLKSHQAGEEAWLTAPPRAWRQTAPLVAVGSLAGLVGTQGRSLTLPSRASPQRTTHTSRMQKSARQVGQGTRLASQVSGRCGSWRLANHLPMQVRHHMGRQ